MRAVVQGFEAAFEVSVWSSPDGVASLDPALPVATASCPLVRAGGS
jgi:hypothetical protein